jgi:hypothetical protein
VGFMTGVESCGPIVGRLSETESETSMVRGRASLDNDVRIMLYGVVALQDLRLNLGVGWCCVLMAVDVLRCSPYASKHL